MNKEYYDLMNELLPILIISLAMGIFFTYKVVKGIKTHLDYQNGKVIKAKIMNIEWIKSPPARFSVLYPNKQLRIQYQFVLNGKVYEKEDDDIYFKYKENDHYPMPKIGDIISVYVPGSNNPDLVTINKTEHTIKPIIGIAFLAIFSFGIALLVIYNWE